MYALVFYFILLSFLTSGLGRFFGHRLSTFFSLFFLFLSLFSSAFIFYEVAFMGYSCEVVLFDWFNLFGLYSPFVLLFDKLSSSMLFLVLFISFFVHLFASNYMQNDPHLPRFFFFLGLFTFFMCFLVISGSLVHFFFAWEGVGLSSYLLIGFWFTRVEASRAAMKAMIINRFGDFGLYFAILLIFVFYKTLLFTSLNALSHLLIFEDSFIDFFCFSFSVQEIICFFLFIAVVGKSAQLGLHTWLPDAMEGPTPVSALLHAATMVTAGVYLLLRMSSFFEMAPNILILISVWGALTAFFAATVGAFQNDIKKIIAYSTCSQLGYMVASCGLNNFVGAYFHLFNHAFFKALLFLGAGVIIHALHDEQDIRKYGGLLNFLPFTFFCMTIASLSLMGAPFLSGFYSKDIIINWAFSDFSFHSRFVYWALLFSAFFTAFYSTKLLFLTFFSSPRFSKFFLMYLTESDFRFKVPLFFLTIFSIVSGYIFFDLFTGYGTDLLNLNLSLTRNLLIEQEYLFFLRKLLPLCFVFLGIFFYIISYYCFNFFFYLFVKFRNLFKLVLPWKNFFTKKWFFDYFYFFFVVKLLNFSYVFLFKKIDKGLIESFFVKTPISLIVNFSNILKSFKSANITLLLFYLVSLLLFFILGLLFSSILFVFFLFYFIYIYLSWKK